MSDFHSPRGASGRPARLTIGLLLALVAMLATATAVGASPALRATFGIASRAKEFGAVVGDSRAAPRLEDRGLDGRHLAHQRRPAFVAAAVSALERAVTTVEEGSAPVGGAIPPPSSTVSPSEPVSVPAVETPSSPEEPPAPPAEVPTQPEEPAPPVEIPAPPVVPPVSEPEEPTAPTEPPVETPTQPVSPTEPEPAEEPLIDADFEHGLSGWNTAGVGEVVPKIETDIVREGDKASKVQLTGEENRSELILGGNGTASTAGTVQFREGDEYWYGFSFYIESMVYGHPGAHNLIMQFKSDGEGSPNFGLQLWNVNGEKGLWTGGPSQEIGNSGERFLAPLSEEQWHDVQIHFKASSVGAGFYEVFLDGQLIDSQSGVSMIVPGHSYAYIKDGLYRNGEEIPGNSDLRLDAAKLGESRESVLP